MNRTPGSIIALMVLAVMALLAMSGCGEDEQDPPVPNDWTFNAVWGAGADDVITVGFDYDEAEPLVMRQMGGTWSLERLDVSDLVHEFRETFGGDRNPRFILWSLGGPAGNMHAAGDWGVVYRFDGTTWTEVYHDFRVTDWRGVWADDEEVVAVGMLGAILHGDADGFTVDWPMAPASSPNLFGVWGSSPDNIWAVGDVVLRYTGTAWQEATNPLNGHWAAIDGRGQADIWMGGESGYIMFFNGMTWEESYRHAGADIVGIHCLPGGEVVALAVHADGTDILIRDGAWRVDATIAGVTLDDVWGSAPDDIYAIGDGDRKGLLYHGDGTGWESVDISPETIAAKRASDPVRP